MFGLITGSGFYDIPDLADRGTEAVDTPFGGPVAVTTGTWRGGDICFIPRHGSQHSLPPHTINYRANVSALKAVGAASIVATAVSGGINPAMTPGTMVLVSDFLNFTSGRDVTFFDGTNRPIVAAPDGQVDPDGVPARSEMVGVTHTDMTSPYDPELRATILRAAADESVPLVDGGVYCTADGPRFETPAEINMMRIVGGDLVGMTGYPVVALAVETPSRCRSMTSWR